MGYWDRKEGKTVAQVKTESKSLESFEKEAQETIIDNANYLSEKIKEQTARMGTVTSDGFWFAVYFNNDKQKEEFLEKLGYDRVARFLEGKEFAKKIGQKLEAQDFEFGPEKKPVSDFANRARPIKKQR